LRSKPSFTASCAITACNVRWSRTALRVSGVSGRPELAPCLAMRSTAFWVMGTPLTVAATASAGALAAEPASLSALQAPSASNRGAQARSIAEEIKRTSHSLREFGNAAGRFHPASSSTRIAGRWLERRRSRYPTWRRAAARVPRFAPWGASRPAVAQRLRRPDHSSSGSRHVLPDINCHAYYRPPSARPLRRDPPARGFLPRGDARHARAHRGRQSRAQRDCQFARWRRAAARSRRLRQAVAAGRADRSGWLD